MSGTPGRPVQVTLSVNGKPVEFLATADSDALRMDGAQEVAPLPSGPLRVTVCGRVQWKPRR